MNWFKKNNNNSFMIKNQQYTISMQGSLKSKKKNKNKMTVQEYDINLKNI